MPDMIACFERLSSEVCVIKSVLKLFSIGTFCCYTVPTKLSNICFHAAALSKFH